jgi:hypothetical protein
MAHIKMNYTTCIPIFLFTYLNDSLGIKDFLNLRLVSHYFNECCKPFINIHLDKYNSTMFLCNLDFRSYILHP